METVVQAAGTADIGSYIHYARWIAGPGHEKVWLTALWPPGFPAIIAAVVGLTGEHQYPLKLMVLSSFFWATALTAFFFMFHRVSARVRFVALSALFLMPSLREYFFGIGVMMSESLSGALFVATLAAGVYAIRSGRWGSYFLVSFLLAVGAHVRAYMDIVNAWVFQLPFLFGLMVWFIRRKKTRHSWKDLSRLSSLGGLLIVSFFFALQTAPWKAYMRKTHGKRAMIVAQDGGWWILWTPDAQLASFHKAGNSACTVSPVLCEHIIALRGRIGTEDIRNISVMTLVAHAPGWVKHRLSNFNWLWFGVPWKATTWGEWSCILEGLLYLGCGLWGLWLLFVRRWDRAWQRILNPTFSLEWVTIGFFVMNFAVFTIVPFEFRYSILWRLYCYLLPIMAWQLWTSESSRPKPSR